MSEARTPAEDRRAPDPAILEALAGTQAGMFAVAESINGLTAGLLKNLDDRAEADQQAHKATRRWLHTLTLGQVLMVLIACSTFYGVYLIRDCVNPGGACYQENRDRADANVQSIKEEQRRAVDQVICDYDRTHCQPGMTPRTFPP